VHHLRAAVRSARRAPSAWHAALCR
jgi:hypothetical protein